jgi:16S rRNA (cytidine1402-2'-O)-methyltransferase
MTLYIVATPIGNLKDITLRALETLKDVDKIYCEDTRRTRTLLQAYEISKPIDNLHQHSKDAKLDRVVGELKSGRDVAYLTDAGTPGVSDPGNQLVEACLAEDIKVVPIPGVSAVTTLLSVAGVPTDDFRFVGFLPTKKGRQTLIKDILQEKFPVLFFETAPRLPRLLKELEGSDCQLIVGRELTKQFEEIVRGTPAQVEQHFQENILKGELTIALINTRQK